MKTKKAWAVFTPRGRLEVDSIRETRRESIAEYCSMHHGCVPKIWNQTMMSLVDEGYQCRKVNIEVEI